MHYTKLVSGKKFAAGRLLVIVLPLTEEVSTNKGVGYLIEELHTRCVPKDMKYIFLPLSYWSQPVLTGWLRWGGPLSS